jgi:hypothetical protein
MMASLDEEITALKASTPHSPPCRLSQEKVLALASLGVPVIHGRCQNPYDDANGVEHLCGCPVGKHPSETAGGNFSHCLYCNYFDNIRINHQKLKILTPFQDFFKIYMNNNNNNTRKKNNTKVP